jgi:ABC-type branched-subunit amino acid transport system substrate-binding protein
LISCCSTAPELSSDPFIYRTVPSDALQGVALAKIAAERNVERLAVIYLDDQYGTQLRDSFRSAYAKETGGDSPSAEVRYESGTIDFGPVVAAALASDPDLILLIAFPIAGAEIIKAWVESGSEPVEWLATDGLKDNQFVLLSGSGMPHVVGTAPTPSSPYYGGFESRYLAAFGGELPGIFTSNQYDAVILLALAMTKAGADPSPRDIRLALPGLSRPDGEEVNASSIEELARALTRAKEGVELDYQGVSGVVDMDDNGDVLSLYRTWSIPEGGGAIAEDDRCFDCTVGSSTTGVTCDDKACP